MWPSVEPEKILHGKAQLVVDVRSPAEFAHAHIPGAISLPLFSNEERAVVGKIYKENGHDAAVSKGLSIAGPKAADLVDTIRRLAGDKEVLLHCWRGGMRSASVAMLLQLAGIRGRVLKGGYKAYRRMVLGAFEKPFRIQILGGYTGSGKTAVLRELAATGQQVIDLEGLAKHKGSAFGNLEDAAQPGTEQFENDLFEQLQTIDPEKTLWLEDESHSIGRVFIPEAWWRQMRQAPVLFLHIPVEARATWLVKDYTEAAPGVQAVEKALEKIRKRLGGQHYQEALELFRNGLLKEAATKALYYYDKAYLYGLSSRAEDTITYQEEPMVDPLIISKNIIEKYAYKFE
ncbi:MAG TPA: tRNA 2-selenouridine(34) synthase MnmH [Bacteroidetes bacterium]|nr:tRNA 2-selenouridine(34) synthase MnmH [Bacteroidota bacterium]HQU38334.1 tRNA 2-selenouridine(34) synthase MnmH [Chitinophagales bacterium]